MENQRPDPDALLRRVQAEEADQTRGKLKVFFGATAGVGKTYAMLQAAHEQQRDGIDVMIGWIETHGRAETEALVQGLPALPSREVMYGGSRLRDFDLDAALSRRPQLLLMDELAHTNAPGGQASQAVAGCERTPPGRYPRLYHRQRAAYRRPQ